MLASICLFLLGASAGAFLVVRHFLRRGLPGWLAVAHGVFGAGGFALLLYFCEKADASAFAAAQLGDSQYDWYVSRLSDFTSKSEVMQRSQASKAKS